VIGDTITRDGVSYVVPEEGAIAEAVDKLLHPPEVADIVPQKPTGDGTTTVTTEAEEAEFITDPGSIENARLWALFAAETPFAVMAPGYLPPGYQYVDRQPYDPGVYQIVPGDDKKVGMKVVYQLHRDGNETDQYMGIMETSWLDAPAAGPGQEVERNGIKYTIVGTNQRVDRIWWKQNDTLYWVSNTLSYYLSSKELLRVAESMIPIVGSESTGR
jgi:hypothetical protein